MRALLEAVGFIVTRRDDPRNWAGNYLYARRALMCHGGRVDDHELSPVDVVRRFVEDRSITVLHEDMTWHRMSVEPALSRVVSGRDAFLEYYRAAWKKTHGDWHMTTVGVTSRMTRLMSRRNSSVGCSRPSG